MLKRSARLKEMRETTVFVCVCTPTICVCECEFVYMEEANCISTCRFVQFISKTTGAGAGYIEFNLSGNYGEENDLTIQPLSHLTAK